MEAPSLKISFQNSTLSKNTAISKKQPQHHWSTGLILLIRFKIQQSNHGLPKRKLWFCIQIKKFVLFFLYNVSVYIETIF